MELTQKHIIIGITGGVAAYKTATLVRRLRDEGARVTVVMTAAAQQFVTPTLMQALSGEAVLTNQWDSPIANAMPHIEPSRTADLIVIAPATADCMAKIAHGLADDLLSTLCLARPANAALALAPAMNVEMWQNPATQRNLQTLKADGIAVWGPASGDQACGEVGAGRMIEPEALVDNIIAHFQPKVLAGKRVLITAGPTVELIDPVRAITNLSSGKMGFAIARAATEAGAKVTLIAGPVAQNTPHHVRRVDVQSAQQMLDEVLGYVNRADVFFSVAAVADWRVQNIATQKIKKDATQNQASNGSGFGQLQFTENPDILATVARLDNAPFCVGFAAETENFDANAQSKRSKKDVPLLVGNDAKTAMGADDNTLSVYSDAGVQRLETMPKLAAARALIAIVAAQLLTTAKA